MHTNENDVLRVTQVNVFPFKEGHSMGRIKALATVVLNDQLHLRGLKVMDGKNGLFVGYPVDPFYKGEEYRSIFSPITRELREEIETKVLEEYMDSVE